MTIKSICDLGPVVMMELINIKGYKGKLKRVKEIRFLDKQLLINISLELDKRHGGEFIRTVHEIETMFSLAPTELAPYYRCWQLGITG